LKKREPNFELLRIVAMLMIITLHYLDKGGILPRPQEAFTPVGLLAWGLEAFCVPAVNVYVLLSAYFLAGRDYRPMRVVRLWAEVLFYSVGIGAVWTVVASPGQFDVYQWMNYVFPVVEEHYWFVTAYLLMCLLAPLMNDTLRTLPAKTYRQGICLLVLLLSVSKSILPVQLPTDRLGYDALWFLCLYLIGAYLRYHALGGRFCGAGYVLCSLLIFGSLVLVHTFYEKTGSLGDFINRQYQYNSLLCLLSSVFLFSLFWKVQIGPGRLATAICKVASASFGVYLIHEHLALRYVWPVWLGVERHGGSTLFILHWLGSILAVYFVCMGIDFGRQLLFEWLGGMFKCRRGVRRS